MLGSPTRAPRIWLDPPPAHSNGLSRYQLYSQQAEPRVAHLPPPFIQPQQYEEQVLRRSVSQLSCQLFGEEKKVSQKEVCPCKPLTVWSEKDLKNGGCSRTTPRSVIKSESARVPTPCQVPEVTTSSKTDIPGSTSGGIPVGIAIARQRVQQTNPSSPLTVQLTACQDRGPQPSPWPSSLIPSHHYQIRGPDQGMTALQSPFQLVRDPVTGQFMLLPSSSPSLACLSVTEGAVQRAVWAGPPPLQVMHPHPQQMPQPLLVDRLVTLATPNSQADKRRNDCLSGMVQVPCDFSKTSPTAAQQGLLIHPAMSPHQAFSTVLVHNMPFPAAATNHQNSFLLSTQLTEQALINQGGVVISNHMENTMINPGQIMGSCSESSFSPQTNLLHHMSPSVVISSHTETNSFVRDLTPSVITALDNQVIVKSEMKSEPLCTMDQATSPPTMEVKPEVAAEEYTEEEEERTTIVADAQNQTETPSNSEEEDTQGSVKMLTEISTKQEHDDGVEDQETSVVQQETTQIVTTQITRTTWTTEQTHHGTVQIEQQEEIKEEVEEVVEREQESQSSSVVDLSGLELLSNTTIAQHEGYRASSPEPEDDGDSSHGADMGGLAVLCQAADYAMSQPHFIPVASSSTSSIVIQKSSLTTSSTVSTSTVSSIELEKQTEGSPRKLSPPRLLPIEKLREVPLKDAFKVLRAKKVKEKKCAPFTISGVDEESPVVDPPVLEPWSATPQRVTPPLCPPTLTPNKKRSCDSPESATEVEPFGSISPPLKKRKFGRLVKSPEREAEPQERPVTSPSGQIIVKPMPPAVVDPALSDQQKHKIRPKLKAEAKMREPEEENEEDMLESSLEMIPAEMSPSWRFKQHKPNSEKTKILVKKVKGQPKIKPMSPSSKAATPAVGSPSEVINSAESSVTPTPTKTTRTERSNLPETRLTETDLKDVPLSIMMFSGGHFVPAQVTTIKAPGIYEVIYLRNPRNRRPQILCTEELLNSAIREVKLDNMVVPVGTRVCSYWSQEYNFMYSGVVSTCCGLDDKFVFVEFDDGDDGKINRDDIRLLPEELNLTDYDPEPSSPLMSRRRRTSDSKSSPDQPKTPTIKVKPLQPPPEEIEEEMEMEEASDCSAHKTEDSDASANQSVGSEEVSETGSDTPPAIYIKNIVEDFLQTEKEKKEKRRLKKEKKRRQMEKSGKIHKHRHREGCRSHHKRKHKNHHEHRHKHSLENSELRIKNSTVSKTGTESGHHIGPLVTTIAKPAPLDLKEEERKEPEPVEEEEEEVEEEEEEVEEEQEPEPSSSNPAVAKASKFAAFLPPRHELWTWKGDGSKRGRGSGQKRGRKIFYKAIQRGSDVINVGDCAVFVSTGRPDRPFIGQVESFWGTQKNSMAVKVSWFYHPEETVGAPEVFPFPGALFKSPHTDSNDVQTISHRCEVVSLPEFKARVDRKEVSPETVYDNQEVYYLAGFYDPQDTSIKYEPGALIEQP